MIDITTHLLRYRESTRHLWNTYLVELAKVRRWDVVDEFKKIDSILFSLLMEDTLGMDINRAIEKAELPFINIAPNFECESPIMINRPSTDLNNYWDDPVKHIKPYEAQLQFIEFFDWDNIPFRDMQYCLVVIRDFPKQPHLVGRRALFETTGARAELITGNDSVG